jgi:hypothetical protein
MRAAGSKVHGEENSKDMLAVITVKIAADTKMEAQ